SRADTTTAIPPAPRTSSITYRSPTTSAGRTGDRAVVWVGTRVSQNIVSEATTRCHDTRRRAPDPRTGQLSTMVRCRTMAARRPSRQRGRARRGLPLLVSMLVWSAGARAQSSQDQALAEQLFQDGKRLMEE